MVWSEDLPCRYLGCSRAATSLVGLSWFLTQQMGQEGSQTLFEPPRASLLSALSQRTRQHCLLSANPTTQPMNNQFQVASSWKGVSLVNFNLPQHC